MYLKNYEKKMLCTRLALENKHTKSIFEGKRQLSLCGNHSMPKATEENPYHTQKQNDLTTKKEKKIPTKKGFSR